MNKGGIGVGSASIVLVFAVLCLTVFSLITYVVASNDHNLVRREAALVEAFYEADALAESVVAQILASDIIPSDVQGIEIHTQHDLMLNADIIMFSAPISDSLAIYVQMVLHRPGDSYDILSWRMYNSSDWEYEAGLNVWSGPPGIDLVEIDDDFGSPWG